MKKILNSFQGLPTWVFLALSLCFIGFSMFFFQDITWKIFSGAFGFVFLLKFSAEFLSKLFLQKDNQMFQVGFTSHMADKIFDEQAKFSEEYTKIIFEIVLDLWSSGPTEQALNHARKLRDIRFKYAIWIPYDISSKLDKGLESKIRKIGAQEGTVKSIEIGELRSKLIFENHELVLKTIQKQPGDEDDLSHYEDVIKYLQNILGIEKLVKIREKILNEASKM